MIVNLAIEGDDHCPVFGRHGLCPTGQVHDGQPPVAEAEMRLSVETFSIRPAMALRFGHCPQATPRRNCGAKRMEQARYAAHAATFSTLTCLKSSASQSSPTEDFPEMPFAVSR